MIQRNIFKGELVRLAAMEPKAFGKAMNRWERDSYYWRLLASDPSRMFSPKGITEWMEKTLEKDAGDMFVFMIRTLDDDRLVGELGLDGLRWNHGDAYTSISLGNRTDWGKGYGTDAMHILLRFAFTELNLHRVSLNVFAYNQRAIRSYEKAGFVYEGEAKAYLNRDGERWDLIYMGILRDEWHKLNEVE